MTSLDSTTPIPQEELFVPLLIAIASLTISIVATVICCRKVFKKRSETEDEHTHLIETESSPQPPSIDPTVQPSSLSQHDSGFSNDRRDNESDKESESDMTHRVDLGPSGSEHELQISASGSTKTTPSGSYTNDEKNPSIKWPPAPAQQSTEGKSGVDEPRSPSMDIGTAKPPKDEHFVNQRAVVDDAKVCYPPQNDQILVVHPPPYCAPTAESPGKGEKAKANLKSKTTDYDKSMVPIPDKGREKSPMIDDRGGENILGGMERALGPDKEKVIENPAKRGPFHKKEKDLQRAGVSDGFDIETYAKREWKGNTAKAIAVLNGYTEIKGHGFDTLRRIRGDNYCAIRASLFQALTNRTPTVRLWEALPYKTLVEDFKRQFHCHWLTKWSFAKRWHPAEAEVVNTLTDCLQVLSSRAGEFVKREHYKERLDYVVALFNDDKNWQITFSLMESIKFLMLKAAVELYDNIQHNEDAPFWAHILFARDTSPNPEAFMKNHLNIVGDTGGLEQVEMFLLGFSLQATVKVMRPSQFGKEDFVTLYPDDLDEDCPKLALVAEDDRHYNILTTEGNKETPV